VNIVEAMSDAELFGSVFSDHATWETWRTVLRSVFGLPMTDEDLARFTQHTGRTAPAEGGYEEAWLVVGRRGGKSRLMALIATYLAAFRDWTPHLAPGEIGTIMVICQDRGTARHVLGYIRSMLLESPMLAAVVEGETQDSITLRGRVVIEVHTASFRSIRGRTVLCGICDEIAFWRDESSAVPDTEILNALRPAMSTIPGAKLICASSPFARRGALWDAYEEHYGKDDAFPLIWQAGTRDMNQTVPQTTIDRAMAKDEPRARAEFYAEFRSDIEQFVRIETVQGCLGPYTIRPFDSQFQYKAFCDPSGGSSDSFTLAISHREVDQICIDAVYEKRPPFSPDRIVAEFADIMRSYRVSQVVGDRYGGELNKELFSRHSISYRVADKSASELYTEMLPLLNGGRITLPRNDTLVDQLVGLQRRVTAAGRELISHGSRKTDHDDVSNVAAGAAWLQSERHRTPMAAFGRWGLGVQPKHKSKFDGVILGGELAGGFASSS
jgi:hypothetical protein